LDDLIEAYPKDPRLYFLKGSILAGAQRYEQGRLEMRRAVEIAPAFHLARFQLGFLEFTSGLPIEAAETWAPLLHLDENAAFRRLVLGLNSLARDEFQEAERQIRQGMEANSEYPLINGDMQLLLDEIDRQLNSPAEEAEAELQVHTTSATHQLLQQFELKEDKTRTTH
jgi:tetratricopeptide (TPR) repeat protein